MSWGKNPKGLPRYTYDHPEDQKYWKAYNALLKVTGQGLMSKREKKKRGFDEEKHAKNLAAAKKVLSDLDAEGINKTSMNIRKNQSRIDKYGSDHITEGILKHDRDKMTKGEAASMANAYEPGLFTRSNPFNTQATRDVATGKSGVVGNTKAGESVYNPKSKTRTAVTKAINTRRKAVLGQKRERSLDRAKSRIF